MIQVLAKGLAVLSLFDTLHPEWTVDQIAEATGFPRMTVYRLVKTLEGSGYLVCDRTNRYHLGPGILAATSVAADRHSGLLRVARPYLEDLAARTGETVTFAVEVDGVAVEIDEIPTSRPFRRHMAPGRSFGYNNTAHGKVFLANKSEAEREAVPFEITTANSISDGDTLAKVLQSVCSEGVAFNYQERDIGTCAVAAPVYDQVGQVVASIAVLVPPGRFGDAQRKAHADAVKEVAGSLSAFLGYLPQN